MDIAELLLQIVKQVAGIQRLPGNPPTKLPGGVHPGVFMDVFLQPIEESPKVTLLDLPAPIGDIPLQGVEELSCIQISQRVRGEITEHPSGPVDVLE
jgi:hypothetical protein